MKRTSFVLLLLAVPAHLTAQDAAPPGHAAAEWARSRACVQELARLSAVDEALAPLSRRAARIRALNAAVSLEDSTAVAPFATDDPLEDAVQRWFLSDGELGRRQAAGEDVQEERTRGRETIRQRLQDELEATATRARSVAEEAGDLSDSARRCQNVTLVRPAVLEVCDTTASPACEAARAVEPAGVFQFVDSAAQLWNMEQIRAWTDPTPLYRTATGSVGGSRTAGYARRGNVQLTLSLEPLIRERSALPPDQLSELEANLDSLGFTFEHPRFIMAPAITFQLDVPGRLGEETHYFLHFGDLSDPPNQVVWSGPASAEGRVQVTVPAGGGALARLAAGEPLSLTAVRVGEADASSAEAVFSLEVSPLGQARAVNVLLDYMANGSLSADLTDLLPAGGSPGASSGPSIP